MKQHIILSATLLTLLFISPGHAAHIHKEKIYQAQWCAEQKVVVEYVLEDRSRVDCLTDTHAVEVEFAPKWKEAIGQALYYAIMTGKKPGVLLILEKWKHIKYLRRIQKVSNVYDIKIWTMRPFDVRPAGKQD